MGFVSKKWENSRFELDILVISGGIILGQLLLYFLSPLNPHSLYDKIFMVVTQLPFFLIILAMVVQLFRTDQSSFRWPFVNAIINYLMVIFMPVVLFDGISNVFHRFTKLGFPVASNGFAQLVTVLITLAISVPVVSLFLSRIKSNIGRIITLTICVFGNFLSLPYQVLLLTVDHLQPSDGWDGFWQSGLLGALAFAVIAFIMIDEWHLNIRNIIVPKLSIPAVVLVGIVAIWYLEEYFTLMPEEWPFPLYWVFGIDFHPFSWSYVWSALEAGIGEEILWRVLVLTLLLQLFKNRRQSLLLAVTAQGVLFGLWHSTNIIAGASVSGVIGQVIFAGSFGIVAGALFVYTKSILVTILLHSVNDLLAFWATGSFLATAITFDWQAFVAFGFQIAFAIIVVVYIFTGSSLVKVRQNAKAMFGRYSILKRDTQ